MSVRLDWEIDGDTPNRQQSGEDPKARRRRRAAQLRFLLVVGTVVLVLGGVVGVVLYRLQLVETALEDGLRDTVDAEVSNIRLGNRDAFEALQRGADRAWIDDQLRRFDDYYTPLKVSGDDVRLTGRAVDIAVDGQRGRVVVEEIIEGVPYGRAWFYWRYEDGWRHVAPDYTWWGDPANVTEGSVTVNHFALDADLAAQMAREVNGWRGQLCTWFTCGVVNPLTIEVRPDPNLAPTWAADDPWRLLVPSPFVDVARLDRPFDQPLNVQVAALLAARTVDDALQAPVQAPSDAAYLRQALVDWLTGRLAGVQTESYLVGSVVARGGEPAAGQLAALLLPTSSSDVVAQVVGNDALPTLDWRDFLTWRLRLERELHASRGEAAFLALYDPTDAAALGVAARRFNNPLPDEQPTVTQTEVGTLADGSTVLTATVDDGAGNLTTTRFRLVDGVWRRLD